LNTSSCRPLPNWVQFTDVALGTRGGPFGSGNITLKPGAGLSLGPNAVLFVGDVNAVIWNIFVYEAHGANIDVIAYS
jgi:hypothetical protein